MRVTWIEHKGAKILFEDYTTLSNDALLDVLHEAEKIFLAVTSPILVLLDFTGAFTNSRFIDEFNRISKENNKAILNSATVGITGIKKVIASAVIKFTGLSEKSRFFDNIEDAKNYLANIK